MVDLEIKCKEIGSVVALREQSTSLCLNLEGVDTAELCTQLECDIGIKAMLDGIDMDYILDRLDDADAVADWLNRNSDKIND